jgi:hypothetical protein
VGPVTKRDVARYRAAHPEQFAGMRERRANARARDLIASLRAQRALAVFIVDFRDRSRAKTWCADGYRVAECGAIAP